MENGWIHGQQEMDDAGKYEKWHILKKRAKEKDGGAERNKRMANEKRAWKSERDAARESVRVTVKDGGNNQGWKTGRNERDVKKKRCRRAGSKMDGMERAIKKLWWKKKKKKDGGRDRRGMRDRGQRSERLTGWYEYSWRRERIKHEYLESNEFCTLQERITMKASVKLAFKNSSLILIRALCVYKWRICIVTLCANSCKGYVTQLKSLIYRNLFMQKGGKVIVPDWCRLYWSDWCF